MKEIQLRAGQRAKVLSLFSNSIPQCITFEVSTQGGAEPTGIIELAASTFPLTSKSVERRDLQAINRIDKSWLDCNFEIFVTSDADAVLTFKSHHFTARAFWLLLVGVLVVGLISGLAPLFLVR